MKESALTTYDQARRRAVQGYSRLVDKTQDFSRHTRRRMREARQENPLALLAIVAGTAFVAGIALRIWRSRAS